MQQMTHKYTRGMAFFLGALIFVSVLIMIPRVGENGLFRGQIGKQTFSAEMARSFANRHIVQIFPMRHFVELHHPGVVPWAEEVPVYTYLAAETSKLTGFPLVSVGKGISFLFFLILLFVAYKIGKNLSTQGSLAEKKIIPLLFIFSFSVFPSFRDYGVSFMPDGPMTTFCALALYFALEEKWFRAFAAVGIAMMFKYYAIFFAAGIFCYYLYCSKVGLFLKTTFKQQVKIFFSKKVIFHCIIFVLFIFPSLFYIYYFISHRIPNPITEYQEVNGHGHFSSKEFLLNFKFYIRMLTWNLIKNPGLIAGLGALASFYFFNFFHKNYFRPKVVRLVNFLIFFQILFMLIFSSSYYVHDYYGLQFQVLVAVLLSLGLNYLFQNLIFKSKYFIFIVIFLLSISVENAVKFYSATTYQYFYPRLAEFLKEKVPADLMGFFVYERTGEGVLFPAHLQAWRIDLKTFEDSKNQERVQFLLKEKAQWAAFMLVDSLSHETEQLVLRRFSKFGWTSVIAHLEVPALPPKSPAAALWVLRRE